MERFVTTIGMCHGPTCLHCHSTEGAQGEVHKLVANVTTRRCPHLGWTQTFLPDPSLKHQKNRNPFRTWLPRPRPYRKTPAQKIAIFVAVQGGKVLRHYKLDISPTWTGRTPPCRGWPRPGGAQIRKEVWRHGDGLLKARRDHWHESAVHQGPSRRCRVDGRRMPPRSIRTSSETSPPQLTERTCPSTSLCLPVNQLCPHRAWNMVELRK